MIRAEGVRRRSEKEITRREGDEDGMIKIQEEEEGVMITGKD